MAITISGSKYSSTIQSVGTYTITVPNTTTFLSADFSFKQRIVALHNPTTNALKGIAYVRKYNNGQSLELETQFYQPWDGAIVTQAVGDKVNVSKNFADVATTGLTILYNTVSIADSLTFGASTNQADTCFYDEDYLVEFGVGAPTTSSFPINFISGVVVFGHLQDYASESITGDVNWTWMGPRGNCTWQASGSHLNLVHYGGGVRTTKDVYSTLINGNPAPASILLQKFFYDSSIIANQNFPVPSRAILRNCIGYGQDANLLVRWKNGTIEGGYFKLAPSASYYAVFGDDSAGTFTIAAPSNKRLVIGGVGANSNTSGASLWRCGAPSNAQIINFTNVISPVRSATNIGSDLPLSVMNYYYSDTITNILSASQSAIWKTIDNAIVDSNASTGTTWSPSVLNDKWAGKTRQSGFPITQWKYRIRKFGYGEILNTINASTYSLGNYTSDNVSFPGSVIQTLDAKQTADGSEVSGISINYSTSTITLTSTNTIESLNNYIKLSLRQNLVQDDFTSYSGLLLNIGSWNIVGVNYLTTNSVFNGIVSTGSLTSNNSLSTITVNGNVTQATPTNTNGVVIDGDLIFNTNTPITVTFTDCTISGTVSNSGSGLVTISLGNSTIGTIGSNVATRPVTSLNLTGLIAGSQIYIANGLGDEVAYVASSGTSYSLDTTGQTGVWSVKVARYGYISQTGSHLPAIASTTLLITLIPDVSITQATKATVEAYTTLENLDKLYDYAAYYETTNAGIVYPRVITKAGTSASAGSYNVTLNNSGAVWSFNGSALSIYSTLTLAGGTTITGSLFTSGTVTLTGLQTNTSITANVLQATPTNLLGMFITGNLTYNTGSAATVTLTDSTVTGTISNSGAASVKVLKAGTSDWFNEGTNVIVRANVSITTPTNLALSTYVLKNGSVDLGWVAQNTARSLEIAEADTFSIYAIAYGYKAKVVSANALDTSTFKFDLLPETFIDTSLNTTTRDFIASKFSTAFDSYSRIALSLDYDLRAYDPSEVMNAVQWFLTTEGNLIAQGVIYGGSVDQVQIISGGISIGTPGFYGKVNDSVTTTGNLGILVPIYVEVLPSVYIIDPTYTPVQKNTSGIVLQTAPWTQQTADISEADKNDIAIKSAEDVWNANERTLNGPVIK